MKLKKINIISLKFAYRFTLENSDACKNTMSGVARHHGNSLKHHTTDKARSSSRLYNFANTLPPLFVICFMSKSLDLNHFLLNSLTYKSPNETVLLKSLYGTNAWHYHLLGTITVMTLSLSLSLILMVRTMMKGVWGKLTGQGGGWRCLIVYSVALLLVKCATRVWLGTVQHWHATMDKFTLYVSIWTKVNKMQLPHLILSISTYLSSSVRNSQILAK